MSFRLLAIRPLKGCDKKFLKNLKENQIYQFYNDFEFLFTINEKNEEVIIVQKLEQNVPEKLYNVDRKISTKGSEVNNHISINISAIVGKNGSGKSALSELFLISLFYISNKLEFVNKEDFLNSEDPQEEIEFDKNLDLIATKLNVEIYYLNGKQLHILRIESGVISKQESLEEKNMFLFNSDLKIIREKSDLMDSFYSMMINYSIYGLNSNQLGIWVKAVFHKNDGYQMPIVMNPYRDVGIIDINIETYLTRGRVLSNLIIIDSYYKKLNSKSEVDKVELYFDVNKNYEKIDIDKITLYREKVIEPLFNLMFNSGLEVSQIIRYPEIKTPIKILAESYLIHKLDSIVNKYATFYEYKDWINANLSHEFVLAIYQNRSHITLKVFQTLNFIYEDIFKIENLDLKTVINFSEVKEKIEEKRNSVWFTEPIDYLPPPFLVSRIVFKDGSTFDDLSSGEKQKIFSLNSIIYHLGNLDSVKKHHTMEEGKKPIVYKNVNIILDEIELYYHLEFQRNFIFEMLDFIKNANFKNLENLNILFLTHSPFILSDIPSQNILFLEVIKEINEIGEAVLDSSGNEQFFSMPQEKEQTFSANIHELLADGFFMDSTKGAFAISEINKFLNLYQKTKRIKNNDHIALNKLKQKFYSNQIYYKKIIGLVGEKYVRKILENHFDEMIMCFENLDYQASKIQRLKEQQRNIEEQIKRLSN